MVTSNAVSGKGDGSYGYRVQACNAGGCGPWSATASTAVLLVPPAPTSISTPASSNGPVAVSWSASATATSYTLQHADYGVTGWSTIYSGAATGYTEYETTTGSWIYQVQACNASGCSAFVVSSGSVAVTIPPASAPSLSVPATSNTGSYTVSWGAVSGATSYTLQESANGGGWNTVQASGGSSWSTSGRGDGSYGYQVQACNAGGCGPWSGIGTISVALVPAVPAGLHTTLNNANKGLFDMAWSAVATATSYQLQQTLPDSTVSTAYSGTATSAQVLDLHTMGQVTVQVRACNASGCSAWSAGVSFMLNSN